VLEMAKKIVAISAFMVFTPGLLIGCKFTGQTYKSLTVPSFFILLISF